MPPLVKIKDVINLQNSIEGRNLPELGTIITENWTDLSKWTTGGAGWSVGSGKLNIPNGASNFVNSIRQTNYGATKLRRWTAEITNYIIPTISGTSFGISFGMWSISASQASLHFRFCTDTTKQGSIEVYYERSATISATSVAKLAITAGDSTSINVRRIKNTMIVTWHNNTTGKEIIFRFEMPANNGNTRPPNFSNFSIIANGGATTVDSFQVTSNHPVGAQLWIASDSIASSFVNNVNEAYPQVLQSFTGQHIACSFGNSDRIEENNWNEIIAHAPKNILISCLTNNVAGDSVSSGLAKLATAISALTGYTYGTNLFITNLMNRDDVDVTAYNTALEAAYSDLIDLSTFKATSGTGIDVAKSSDGIHPNAEGHFDYATILFTYFLRKGKLNISNNILTYNRPVYFQNDKLVVGESTAVATYRLEQYDVNTSSRRVRGTGATVSSGLFEGVASGVSHYMFGIARENGAFVAKQTSWAGFVIQPGSGMRFYQRTGATIGTTYNLDEAVVGWVLTVEAGGKIKTPKTITAAGTTGARTINSVQGQINFAAGASTLIVTNSLVDVNSTVVAQVYGTDTTATSVRVTKAAGSFTLTLNAAATAETSVGFIVLN